MLIIPNYHYNINDMVDFLKMMQNIVFYENEELFSVKNYEQGSTISKFPVVIISKIINGNLCEFKNFLVKTLFLFLIFTRTGHKFNYDFNCSIFRNRLKIAFYLFLEHMNSKNRTTKIHVIYDIH